MASEAERPSFTPPKETPIASYFRTSLSRLFVDQRNNIIMIHDHEDDERPAEKFLGGRVLLPPGTDSKIAIRSWSKSESLSDENVSISVNNEQYLISDRAMTEADTPNQPLDDDTILVLQGLLFSRRPTWTRNESRALSNIQLKHYEMLDREA